MTEGRPISSCGYCGTHAKYQTHESEAGKSSVPGPTMLAEDPIGDVGDVPALRVAVACPEWSAADVR